MQKVHLSKSSLNSHPTFSANHTNKFGVYRCCCMSWKGNSINLQTWDFFWRFFQRLWSFHLLTYLPDNPTGGSHLASPFLSSINLDHFFFLSSNTHTWLVLISPKEIVIKYSNLKYYLVNTNLIQRSDKIKYMQFKNLCMLLNIIAVFNSPVHPPITKRLSARMQAAWWLFLNRHQSFPLLANMVNPTSV